MALEYIDQLERKLNRRLKILDIGAGQNPWALDKLTAVLDPYIPSETREIFIQKQIKLFEFSCENSLLWGDLLTHVSQHGNFDFVICSHTLEDLNYPEATATLIKLVGNAGYIAVPSRYAEAARFQYKLGLENPYRGYEHHRWIYRLENSTLIGYPKMGWQEKIQPPCFWENPELEQRALHTEIAFLWENDFDCRFVAPFQMLGEPAYINEFYTPDDLPLSQLEVY